MPKKARSQRRKKGASDNDNGNTDEVEYLSECHTIATLASVNTNDDDDDSLDGNWDIHNDDLVDETDDSSRAAAQVLVRHEKLMEVLGTLHDFMGEKRSSKREGLLRQWFRALTQYATSAEPVETRRDDLLQACQQAIRTGSPSEQYAACRVLESASVLIGDEDYFELIRDVLLRVVQSNHRAIPVRVAALRVMGLAVFIGVDDDVVTEQILDLCEMVAQTEYRGEKTPNALRTAALDVWTLLATTIHELYVAGKDDVSTGRGLLLLPLLLECLEQNDDMSLRAAAGESVAWIHTARLQLGLDDDEGDNTTERKYALGTWEGSDWEDIMAEIEIRMEELSNQSGHYMSKKSKKEQRATFREYLATVQDNEAPTHAVNFRGGSLELTTWKDIIALNATRRCLQGGFQIQLMTNPILQAIFGANGQALNNANGGYSKLEKRLILSKTSEAYKAKDLERHKKQRNRSNMKNSFLTADGEEM